VAWIETLTIRSILFNLFAIPHLEEARMSDLAQLIKRFESDIKYDATGTMIKISRSDAAKELLETADRRMLAILARHLREDSVSGRIYADLPMAWGILLNDIGHRLNLTSMPDRYNNLPAWIDWAEQNGQAAPSEQASPLA
jgi:hypothetical protein